MNACNITIRIWNTAHAHCNTPAKMPSPMPLLNNKAIKIKIISPAYKLPNKRSDKEIGLEISPTNSRKKLIGINNILIGKLFASNG